MKYALIVVAVLPVAQILACCQQLPAHAQSVPLTLEDGVIANGSYSNECAGISFPIPKGWKITKKFARNLPQVSAERVSTDQRLLLSFTRDTGGNFHDWIALTAIDARGATLSVHDFISRFARSDMLLNNRQQEMPIRDAFLFELGGRRYFRSDYMRTRGGATELYRSFVATSFRNYFLVWTVTSISPNNLDNSISSLQNIVFREDHRNPLCDAVKAEKSAP